MEVQVNGKTIKFGKNSNMVNVSDLVPYARNPKEHNETDINLIIKSIERNGFGDNLLVCPETMEVLSGNGRLIAAKKMGLKQVPIVYAPDGLTEKQKADLVIASNKLVEVSGYNNNFDILVSDFGLDITDFGMTPPEEPQPDEPQDEIDITKKKVKLSFAYTDSREIIDMFIREMQANHPELMTKVEISD